MSKNQMSEPNLITLICSRFYKLPLTGQEELRLSQFVLANQLDKKQLDKKLLHQLDEADNRQDEQLSRIWNRIKGNGAAIQHIENSPKVFSIHKGIKIGIAAAVLAISGLLVYKSLSHVSDDGSKGQKVSYTSDITPGNYKATLLLSNNSTVELNNKLIGHVATEDGTEISKPDSTQIIYYAGHGVTSQEPGTNILNTPRAGTFKVTLPDKSVMYLNAESSVVYPVAFTGPVREITLFKGEVYFEVQKSSKPFIVRKGDKKIEVLGTKFNINTYKKNNAENITATLLEGSIQVTKGGEQRILTPREQITFAANSETPEIKRNVNIEGVVSWKNGFFTFSGLSYREIMDELQRWYDVTIEIDSSTLHQLDQRIVTLSRIPKSYVLSEVLTILGKKGEFTYEMRDARTVKIIR